MAKMKSCFFASQIGEPESQERGRSDDVLRYIISPVIRDVGYDEPQRADQVTKPGTISAQVYERLLNADLVIANLSGANPNVFYELAVRHMLMKPFVHLVERSQRLPFDIAHERTIHYTLKVGDVEQAKTELKAMVMASESDPRACETILSRTIAFSPDAKT